MTLQNLAYLLIGTGIGYVLGSLFYRPPKHGAKYVVTEIPSANVVRALKK